MNVLSYKTRMTSSGAYILRIRRIESGSIRVGAKGLMEFPMGDYLYVGQAEAARVG